MKKFLVALLLICSCSMHKNEPDGAYESAGASDSSFSLNDIKIFKNAFWMSATFDENGLYSCSGGVYKLMDNKCLRTYYFNFPDTGVIAKTDTISYHAENDAFWIEEVNNDTSVDLVRKEYIKMKTTKPLQNSLLEGVWKLTGRQIGNVKNFDDMEDGANIAEIKIYSYPYVAWAQYNFIRKTLIGAGGGTYRFNGDTLTERHQYITYPVPLGQELKNKIIKLSSTKVLQVGNAFREDWEKVKQTD